MTCTQNSVSPRAITGFSIVFTFIALGAASVANAGGDGGGEGFTKKKPELTQLGTYKECLQTTLAYEERLKTIGTYIEKLDEEVIKSAEPDARREAKRKRKRARASYTRIARYTKTYKAACAGLKDQSQ